MTRQWENPDLRKIWDQLARLKTEIGEPLAGVEASLPMSQLVMPEDVQKWKDRRKKEAPYVDYTGGRRESDKDRLLPFVY
jgi:hypothetical protein